MKVTCDDCGSVQPTRNQRCELCGASLSEELERKEQGSLAGLLFGAVGATLALCVLPGVGIKLYFADHVATSTFVLGYVAVWVIGSALARYFTPKEEYNFGVRVGHYGFVDNPLSLRDNYDRAHAKAGLVLLPMGIVAGLWGAVLRKLFTRRR